MMMIKLLLIAYTSLIATGSQKSNTCTVTIEGLKNKKGTIYIGWYNNASDFLKVEKAVYYQKAAVANTDKKTFIFSNIPVGNYAISLFLDEDGNGKLSTNVFGIPSEKYAFSNNVKPAFRPATFNEAMFNVNTDKHVNIRIK